MAATITYKYPVTGTTPPTAAQAAACNSITAVVQWASFGTAVMTHNWNISAAELAQKRPWIIMNTDAPTVDFVASLVGRDTNTISIYSAESGSDFSVEVTLLRPHSIIT